MSKSGMAAIDRRMAIGGALAGAAGLALPLRQNRPVTQRGIVGGGLARFEQGEANFSLFASRLELSEDDKEVVLGTVLWVDSTVGLTLRSTAVTRYIVSEEGRSRHIIGTMSVNGADEYPFELEILDADDPGSSVDMAHLKVGGDAPMGDNATPAAGNEFGYTANGTVVTGDLQDLHFEIDLATGVVRSGEG
jgi:hypothetical protein